ncbi:methyltransferase family protein [Rhizobium subbaraonis]|uniref:Methyltransferase family protein n=1 Tax=Rhizobium subbaraonis TaxID=908946 RepID=A0A285V6B4_9HYPH|nr:class I SAM-dependent methyltransferase [Rhizobium subbaraonis]SOC48061.1 methyltransferase family protein [Rhizobium subbaraonis]
MIGENRRAHWDHVYLSKGEAGVSWFEPTPTASLDLIRRHAGSVAAPLADIGGGASHLVDSLLEDGFDAVTVLDLSAAALEASRRRLGADAGKVEWIVADVTTWEPMRSYDIWHDRAAFHFLTEPKAREAYIERLRMALSPGGHAIIATFAPDGPERCSGLPVVRYDPATLAETIGAPFRLVDERRCLHTTPWGSRQAFQYSVLERS